MRQGHWAVVDLIGKGGHIRTVPIPEWVKAALDQWAGAAGVKAGRIFRAVARTGKVWGKGISQNVVWYVVRTCCQRVGLEHIAPHDLRRTCAKLCHSSGGELEQIQFLLGHASVQTTERYLGCKQNLGHPVNDLFDLKADVQPQEMSSESVTVEGSTPVEMAARHGIECRHGEHDQPIPLCHPKQPNQGDLMWSRSEKAIARKAFEAALRWELHEVTQGTKQMASRIRQASDLRDLEHYLTERLREIGSVRKDWVACEKTSWNLSVLTPDSWPRWTHKLGF
jgi:hypothetical protein